MELHLELFLLLFHLLMVFARGALVNRTIDDQLDDSVTGNLVS